MKLYDKAVKLVLLVMKLYEKAVQLVLTVTAL